MSEELRAKGQEFARFLQTLPEELRIKGNDENHRKATEEHGRFREAYQRGHCYLCGKPLSSFSTKIPCPHWLLKPHGFKKKHLPAITARYGCFQIQSFLRWLANEHAFGRNINDMPEEGTPGKVFELTIRYRKFEWAFSCAEADYFGHSHSQHARHAHYHFQMRIDKRPFIDYGDFHLPLSEMDVINIEAMRALPHLYKQRFSFGEGMKDVMQDELLGHIVNSSTSSGNEQDAPFKLDTLLVAEEGKKMKGEDIYKVMQEAKEKGVTMASLMHKVPNAEVRIIVSPGPGVVEQAPRSKSRR